LAFTPPAIQAAAVPGDMNIVATTPPVTMPQSDSRQAPADDTAAAKALLDESPAIVCRLPQPLPGSRFSGPRVCRSKGEWALLRAQGKDISPDGRTIVNADAEARRAQDILQPCTAIATGSATTGLIMRYGPGCF
jgi:hypothetical protein